MGGYLGWSIIKIVMPESARRHEFNLVIWCSCILCETWNNWPVSYCHLSLFQNKSVCKTIYVRMSLSPFPIQVHFHVIKPIFVWNVLVMDQFWNRGTRYLGNDLFISMTGKTGSNFQWAKLCRCSQEDTAGTPSQVKTGITFTGAGLRAKRRV